MGVSRPCAGLAVVALAALAATGCAARFVSPRSVPVATREFSARTAVYGRELTLHLASPPGPRDPASPLVLYASGDGGWFGAAVAMYRALADSGLRVVGFSARAFMHSAQAMPGSLTGRELVEGYQAILDAARRELRLPDDVPVVLTGWSRGASLAVLVAGEPTADSRVIGVVAIGLAARDHLDVAGETDDDTAPGIVHRKSAAPPREGELDMYSLVSRVAPRRCAVIQASRDGYLPAAEARALFGADTDVGRLYAIDARNHRFDGGEAAFADALHDAIAWVSARPQ